MFDDAEELVSRYGESSAEDLEKRKEMEARAKRVKSMFEFQLRAEDVVVQVESTKQKVAQLEAKVQAAPRASGEKNWTMKADSKVKMDGIPSSSLSGHLNVKSDRKWRRMHVVYKDTELYFLRKKKDNAYQVRQITWASRTTPELQLNDMKSRLEESSNWLLNEGKERVRSEAADICFKSTKEASYFYLFTATSAMLCCTIAEDSEEKKGFSSKHWIDTIQADLKSYYSANEFKAKTELASSLAVTNRTLVELELQRYTDLIFTMAASGLFTNTLQSDVQGITGVMRVVSSLDPASREWKENYCVLSDVCILIFESSASPLPTGVIMLKFATVSVHNASIRGGRQMLCIQTPLRTYYLLAKHDVALSEWLASLEKTIVDNPVYHNSNNFLKRIFTIQWEQSHMVHLLENPTARRCFHKYIVAAKDAKMLNKLTLFRKINTYRSFSARVLPAQRAELRDALLACLEAGGTEWKGLGDDEKANLQDVNFDEKDDDTTATAGAEASAAYTMTSKQLNDLRMIQLRIANELHDAHFQSFKESRYFQDFAKKYTDAKERFDKIFSMGASDAETDEEDVGMDGKMLSTEEKEAFRPKDFVLRVQWHRPRNVHTKKEAKDKTKLVSLPRGKTVFTIGRASTNDLQIEDRAISRSHCRLDWTKNADNPHGLCILTDVGSQYGTRVNDQPIQKARVKANDVINIGKSTTSLTILRRSEVRGNGKDCVVC